MLHDFFCDVLSFSPHSFLGDSFVGKSQLLLQATDESFSPEFEQTLGVEMIVKEVSGLVCFEFSWKKAPSINFFGND